MPTSADAELIEACRQFCELEAQYRIDANNLPEGFSRGAIAADLRVCVAFVCRILAEARATGAIAAAGVAPRD